MHLPIEFLIIGTSITLHKKTVTSKEVNDYQNRCTLPLEWNEELHYCTYDAKKDTYTIKDNLTLHPYILQILTNF